MAKQKINKFSAPVLKAFELFPFTKSWVPYVVLALTGFVFYINTMKNEFALDDGIIINDNEYVMQGVNGIDSIMSRDAYQSFYKHMHASAQLAGGRYRPLSIASFAVEQEFIGKFPGGIVPANGWDTNKNGKMDPSEDVNKDGLWNTTDAYVKGSMVRHLNNVLFYILSVLLIYMLFRNHMFPQFPDLAFLSAFLFCIHPIHTEVIANVKSRDEIFSIIFIALTFINVFKFRETGKYKYIAWTVVNYFLSLLSKEYAVMLIWVIPASLFLFDANFSIKKYSSLFLLLGATLFVYLMMRFSIVPFKKPVPDKELLNNPFLLAKHTQVIGTKIFIWLKYLVLLLFPFILSSDYSYNSIPYRNLTSPETLLSLAIYIGLVILTFKLFRKKHPAAWGLLFFFANFLMICNFFMDIGATMGERLVFHSSLGFTVCLAWVAVESVKKYFASVKIHRAVLLSCLTVVTIAFGWRTVTRNADWKNDITLFTHDVKTMPNSVLCLGNAGARYIDLSQQPVNKEHKKEYLAKAITSLSYSVELHPKYTNGYLNLGLANFYLNDFNKAEDCWMKAYNLYHDEPHLVQQYFPMLTYVYTQQAFADAKDNKLKNSQYWFERALRFNSNDSNLWYNLGGVSFNLKDYTKAKEAFTKCLQLNPNNEQAKTGLASCPV